MYKKILLTGLSFLGLSVVAFSATYTLNSPSKNLKVLLSDDDGSLSYTLADGDVTLVNKSAISIFDNKKTKVLAEKTSTVDQTWKPTWGQFSEIRDNHNESIFDLDIEGRKARLVMRLFDDGLGFRYELDNYKTSESLSFNVEYAIDKASDIYYPTGEAGSKGPVEMTSLKNTKPRVSKKNAKNDNATTAKATAPVKSVAISIPIVADPKNGKFLGLIESDLLATVGFGVIGTSYDVEKEMIVAKNKVVEEFEDGDTLKTAWRVILVADQVGDLSVNNVTLNLATECQLEDASWVKPRKCLWDWRVLGHTAPDGFVYRVDNASYFRLIDFAKKEGIDAVLIDDLWYTKVTTGKFTLAEKFELDVVLKYAKDKGVDIFIYYDRHKGLYGDEALFKYFGDLGTVGAKYGFMGRKVGFSNFAIKEAAKNKLLVNFHDGPVPFAGGTRTYPNAITREFCHAQQDGRRAFTQETFLKQALVNSLQGPLDMNNGNFAIKDLNEVGKREKMVKIANSYITTSVNECARCLIINTGFLCIPDAPDAYEAKIDLFEFIKNLPTGKWDESKVLFSKIPEYVTMMRRKGDEYFIGSSSVKARTLDITLDFLKAGKEYDATIYQDAPDTNCISNPEAYEIKKIKVKKGDVIKAVITENSGHCLWIR